MVRCCTNDAPDHVGNARDDELNADPELDDEYLSWENKDSLLLYSVADVAKVRTLNGVIVNNGEEDFEIVVNVAAVEPVGHDLLAVCRARRLAAKMWRDAA